MRMSGPLEVSNRAPRARRYFGRRLARVATSIGEFYDTFAPSLTPAERQEIGRAAKHIAGRIDELPKDRQDQRYVMECGKPMEHVLELSQVS